MTNFREALKARGVVPNSTWIREGGSELYVVLPEDDESVKELIASLGCTGQFENGEVGIGVGLGWIRVARMRIEGKTFAGVDVVFVPLFLGQIDHGTFTRIG